MDMAEMSALSRMPVVVILGATGTGKSKLAVELASRFKGEIISADSMQVYKGLDILTNKVTNSETNGVPHHMISVVEPEERFNVMQFRNRALPIVERVLLEGKLPFIVGGTSYYIESLLWRILIDQQNSQSKESERLNEQTSVTVTSTNESIRNARKRKADDKSDHDSNFGDNEILSFISLKEGNCDEGDLKHWTGMELYSALQQVDPIRTIKLHPNDRRKVIRSLQIRFQTGRKHSDLIAEQCAPTVEQEEGTLFSPNIVNERHTNEVISPASTISLGGPMRFPNCFCLWIQAPNEILFQRIENRVDEMVEKGLREELNSHMSVLTKNNSELNYEEGLLQSIGFKEFNAYLELPISERATEKGDKLFLEGKNRLKVVTNQYAKKQIKWIKQRVLRPARRQVPPVYWLDGSSAEPSDWEKNVYSISENILQAHLMNKLNLPLLRERRVPVIENDSDYDLISRTCEVCDNRIFIGTHQWKSHLKSAKHKKMLRRKSFLEVQNLEINNTKQDGMTATADGTGN